MGFYSQWASNKLMLARAIYRANILSLKIYTRFLKRSLEEDNSHPHIFGDEKSLIIVWLFTIIDIVSCKEFFFFFFQMCSLGLEECQYYWEEKHSYFSFIYIYIYINKKQLEKGFTWSEMAVIFLFWESINSGGIPSYNDESFPGETNSQTE
jgi:hypothetical protein